MQITHGCDMPQSRDETADDAWPAPAVLQADGALPDEARLWATCGQGDAVARETLIAHYLPYARVIAAKLYAGRFHDQFEFDEYLQFATVGLLEAVERFDPVKGAQFKTFASRRMMGAILNGLERLSEQQQQIAARQRLAQERLASLKEEEGPATGDPERLFHYLAEVGIGMALSYLLEGTGLVDTGERLALAQYDSVEMKQLQRRVQELVGLLPEKEQLIIRYHYLQEMSFQEVALRMDLTKGRISQLHKKALESLRYHLAQSRQCDVAW